MDKWIYFLRAWPSYVELENTPGQAEYWQVAVVTLERR